MDSLVLIAAQYTFRVVLRALTTLGTNAKRFTGDGPLQPEQVIGEIKNLLELLALLLETFEVGKFCPLYSLMRLTTLNRSKTTPVPTKDYQASAR